MSRKLKVGEQILVRVEEVTYEGALIVEFAGLLLRVLNQSKQTFKAGDRVFLRVSSENPLGFQVVKKNLPARRADRIDRLA